MTYLAELIDSPDSKVIIKEFNKDITNSEQSILKELSSEVNGIQRFIESFSVKKKYFQVFEYIPKAETLRKLIDDYAPLTEKKTIPIALKLSKILKNIHAHGFVHRDIKPSNILITPDEDIILIDFGIATKEDTKHKISVGTVKYAPPEQYHRIAGTRSDIYSFGVVLYEMLTGYKSKDLFSFKPIQKFNPNISLKLAKIISRCLELDPQKRPSADDIYSILMEMNINEDK